MRRVYFNNRIIPENEAKVSIYDSALMYGDMVFEMTRSFGGRQFKLYEHLRRLYAGLKYFSIDPQVSLQQLEEICAMVQQINSSEQEFKSDDEHRLMINVSRGPLSIYHDVAGVENRPTVIVADFPLRWTVAGFSEYYDTGIEMVTVPQMAIPHRYLDPKVKCRSRAHLMMANIQAALMKGNPWALLMDENGYVAEGTGDNFFIVKGEELFTPEGNDCLRGISRQYIIEKYPIETSCARISEYDVTTADEAFIVGTPFCVLPVTRFNGKPIGDVKVGRITKRIIKWWSESVGVDIVGQIKAWDADGAGKRPGMSPYGFLEE